MSTVGCKQLTSLEKSMETTIVYWGYIRNNEKDNGNYHSIFCKH